jgi:regulator of RNase E activity RraB
MNKRIQELAIESAKYADYYAMLSGTGEKEIFTEKFAELIVYDFLSELTNDDALGEARIATIKRLAEKWGVARDGRGEP